MSKLAQAVAATIALASASTTWALNDERQIVKTLQGAINAIGMVRGKTPQGTWVGGAVVIAQNDCFVAATTAGHNIIDGAGNPTAELSQITLNVSNYQLEVLEAHTDPDHPSTTPPEHDWAVIIARKPSCNLVLAVIEPRSFKQATIPKTGMPVALACYHHDRPSLQNQLSRQDCTLYRPGRQFDGLYANKAGDPVGLHSCTAKLGTSGCPLIVKDRDQLHFIGTQIEAHYASGAGVARLFDDRYHRAYLKAVERMQRLDLELGRITAN